MFVEDVVSDVDFFLYDKVLMDGFVVVVNDLMGGVVELVVNEEIIVGLIL